MPTPQAVLTTLLDVRRHLPDDHPAYDQNARDRQLSARRRWFAGRFQS
jgi:hypothetical protein